MEIVDVVPAQPGYFALDRVLTCFTGKDIAIIKMPVMAWIIRVSEDIHQSTVEPVCFDGLSHAYRNEVLHPEGCVVAFGDRSWATYDAFVADTLEAHKREYERKEEIIRRAHNAARA